MDKKGNPHLAEYLLRRRMDLNVSQDQMARRCNMPTAMYMSFEEGYSFAPHGLLATDLAHGCGITTEQLLKWCDKKLY